MGRLYRVAEAAVLWDVSRVSVRKEIRAGKVRTVRIRGAIRIPQSEIERIYREGTRAALPQQTTIFGESPSLRPF
jgi:excisionase family DNA binding protein